MILLKLLIVAAALLITGLSIAILIPKWLPTSDPHTIHIITVFALLNGFVGGMLACWIITHAPH